MQIQIPVQTGGVIGNTYQVWDVLTTVTMQSSRQRCENPVSGDLVVLAMPNGEWSTVEVVSHVREAGVTHVGGPDLPRAVVNASLFAMRPLCVFYATADDVARTAAEKSANAAALAAMLDRGNRMIETLNDCERQAEAV